jgi:hypothetical protein
MIAARQVLLVIAALGLAGCAALNRSTLPPRSRPVAERTLDVDQFVAEHNRNADLIQSLKAEPNIAVRSKAIRAQADGKLGMVRPQSFKLELSHSGQKMADIGSNEDEFWFWVQNEDDRSIYWCKYSDLESSALSITYQPDWIMDALGLKPITPEEADSIRVEKTDNANLSAVVFPPARSRGESYQRMMIVSNYTRRVKTHRIYAYAGDRRGNILAEAVIPAYKEIDIERSESGAFQSCYLPESLRLEWKKDQLMLDVSLKDVIVNQFDSSRAAAIFVEPAIPGYQRVNLADMARSNVKDNRTTVRRTLPPPASRNGVKLGRPTPVMDEPDQAPHAARAAEGRRAAPGRISSPLEDVVQAPLPLPVGSESAAARWAAVDEPPIGR